MSRGTVRSVGEKRTLALRSGGSFLVAASHQIPAPAAAHTLPTARAQPRPRPARTGGDSSESLGHLIALGQHRFRLRQPERHLHGTVHLAGGGEFTLRLVLTPHPLVERAEAEVAVRGEGTHAQLLG